MNFEAPMFPSIKVIGTHTGRINMWCEDHPWWMRDQLNNLDDMIERATEHLATSHDPS